MSWQSLTTMDEHSVELAEQLLIAHCSPTQRVNLRRGFIEVQGSAGGMFVLRYYSSPQGWRRFLFWKWPERWCIVWGSERHLPEADRLLGLKLLLEADERKFRRIGMPMNHMPLWWWVSTCCLGGSGVTFILGVSIGRPLLGLLGLLGMGSTVSYARWRTHGMRF